MLMLNDPSLFEQRILIGGRWLETSARIPVDDAASGEIIGSVADSGAAETRQAIAAAEAPSTRGASGRRPSAPRCSSGDTT